MSSRGRPGRARPELDSPVRRIDPRGFGLNQALSNPSEISQDRPALGLRHWAAALPTEFMPRPRIGPWPPARTMLGAGSGLPQSQRLPAPGFPRGSAGRHYTRRAKRSPPETRWGPIQPRGAARGWERLPTQPRQPASGRARGRAWAPAQASRVWRWDSLILPRSSTLMITTSSLSPICTTSATFST